MLALMYSANPQLSGSQARSILFSTADDRGAAGWDNEYGWGRVNASRAVALALSTAGTNVPDTLAPSIPSNVAASSVTSSRVTLSWSPSVDNVLVTQYNVWRNGVKIGSVSGSTTYADSSVTAQTTYAYAVSARDAAGNESVASAAVQVTTQATPFSVTGSYVAEKTASTASIVVTTSAAATVTVRYGASATALGSSASGSVLSTSQTVSLSGLARRTKYFYQATATGPGGQTAAGAVLNFRTR